MTKIAVTGMQWGDEAKAKMLGYLLKNGSYQVVARYSGGRNAGHTQIGRNGEEVISHLVPAGILTPDVYNMILAGVFLDPIGIIEEINHIKELGYDINPGNLGISSMAQTTLQYHMDFEEEWERKKGKKAIGTTKKGIGPTAVSTAARESIRFGEFLNPESFKKFLMPLSRKHGNIIPKRVNVNEYLKMYRDAQEFLSQFVVDDAKILSEMKDKNWIYEGAQGTLLDMLYGTIPFVTSSTPHNPPSDTDENIGVAKAYITRVGGGKLMTRMEPSDEKRIRGIKGKTPGAEFGATTGRLRGCGWFDAVAAKYAAIIGRINKVAITKLDRLSGFQTIKVAVDYKHRGSLLEGFPADRYVYEEAEPVFIEFPGWFGKDISDVKEPGDLPVNAQAYIRFLEDVIKCPVSHVSVGQRADQTIQLIGD